MTEVAPILSIEALELTASVRGRPVIPVADANITVFPGEIVGLVGESGSGKTLSALAVTQLLPENVKVSGGAITVAGHNMLSLSESELIQMRGAAVGMVFQDSLASLNPTMQIGKQVTEIIRLHKQVSKAQAQKQALEVLASVGLPQPRERFEAFAHQLSGGMRQRVAIAMAIACEPHLIIADEPTTALDVTIQAQILELLRHLADDRGVGILLITHDLGVVANVADRANVMYGGRTVEFAEVIDLFEMAHHPYSQALIDSAPKLTGPVVVSTAIAGSPPDPTRPEPGCPFAPRCSHKQSDCIAAAPKLTPISPTHTVACFHHLAKDSHE
jgi:oligopeptide/dipeptide ABC transporter ATP-binding protein